MPERIILYKSHDLKCDEAWDIGAEEFALYSKDISFYKEGSDCVLNLINYSDFDSICDLGSGSSGIITNLILDSYPNIQEAFCVDASKHMLDVCSDHVDLNKTKLIHARAENFSEFLPHKVDLVIVNCAFWLFDTTNALKQISLALKDEGNLIFNFPEWDFHFKDHPLHPKYRVVDEELELRNIEIRKVDGNKKKTTKEEVLNYLDESGFFLVQEKTIDIEAGVDDWLNFYSIPSIVKRSMPLLSIELGTDILKTAIHKLPWDQFYPVKWVFFHAKKKNGHFL